jgi:hypothetical protein
MKTRILSVLIALAFSVLSCASAPRPSSQGRNSLPTPDPGFQENYSEDPYAIPIPRGVIEALAIEDAIEKSQQGLPGSRGLLLSAVEPSPLEDAVREFQHDVPVPTTLYLAR